MRRLSRPWACSGASSEPVAAEPSRQQRAEGRERAAVADLAWHELATDLVCAGPDHFQRHVEDDREPHPGNPMIAGEKLGDVGRKLHTARSRNDQVNTDFRLWIRDALDRVNGLLKKLQQVKKASEA